jgi:dihydroxy-acid dehydratase
MRSDQMKKGPLRAPHRSLLKALGFTDREIQQPLIGIASSANEIIPGHMHLKQVEEAVKTGILMGGGTPMVFSTIGICDGLAMDHPGMNYSLPSRELIADSIEIVAKATPFDGLVFISNCDKITPAMLMAMGRLNIPSVLVSGGPMLAGSFEGQDIDLVTVFEAVGRFKKGDLPLNKLLEMENAACPGAGSCAGLFTANSMNALSEALGLSLQGNGTIPAVFSQRLRLAKESGLQVMELVKKEVCPRDIVNHHSFHNAIVVDLAFGGSSNTVLHLPAVAREFGIHLEIDLFDTLSRKVPRLCSLSPVGNYHIQDLDRAGGVYAIMNRLMHHGVLREETQTLKLTTIADLVSQTPVRDDQVIRPFDNPFNTEGGIAILYGNLAQKGAVLKQSGVPQNLQFHQGPALVYEDGETAAQEILAGKVKRGDVVVIRNEGPKGGPGMREMLSPTSALVGMGLVTHVVLITDGRFSGGSTGAAIGHISPEAAEKGLIAVVEKGDLIRFDLEKRSLDLMLNPAEIEARLKKLVVTPNPLKNGVLKRYSQSVQSAASGAVFKEGT